MTPLADPRLERRWVAWREIERGGKLTKLPINPHTGKAAKSNDPVTWGTRAQAEAVKRKAGVGVMLGELDDDCQLVGVDLDTCRNSAGGFEPWASEVIDALASYAEVSPSGTGAKILFTVDSAEGFRSEEHAKAGSDKNARHPPSIDFYTGGRFFAVTGDALNRHPLRHVDAATVGVVLDRARKFSGKHRDDSPASPAPHKADALSDEQLFAVIDALPESYAHYADWIRAGQALKHERGDDGFRFWLHLSAEVYPEKFTSEDELRRKWRSFKAEGVDDNGRAVRIGTLIRDAINNPDETRALDRSVIGGHFGNPLDRFEDLDADDDSPRAMIFAPYEWPDATKIPRRQFLYGSTCIRGFVSCTIAPGGVGKTALTITEALAMVSGVPLLGDSVPAPLNVCIWNLEDDKDEMARRLAAARLHYADQLKGADLSGLTVKAADSSLTVAKLVRGQVTINEKLVDQIIAGLRAARIDVLIVDPFISSHGVAESDNDAIDAVMKKAWARIAREARCAVHLIHHTRKNAAGERYGDKQIADARGASALIDASRYARVVNRMSREEAKSLGIAPEAVWRYLRIDDGKHNLSPPAERAVWRQLESVTLPNHASFEAYNGDRVGVVTAWEAPKATLAEISPLAVLKAMGDEIWLSDSKSKRWVGMAFARAAGIDNPDGPQRTELKNRVSDALAAGWLEVAERKDPATRHMRNCVVASGDGLDAAALI